MAGHAFSLPHALYPHFVILAQLGRALLSGPYRLHHRAGFRPGRGTVAGDCRLSRRAQQKYQALRLARQGRGHPAQDRGGTAGHGCHPDIIIMFSYLRDDTLALNNGASLTTTGGLTVNGSLGVDAENELVGGSSLNITGRLTNSGIVAVGNGSLSVPANLTAG